MLTETGTSLNPFSFLACCHFKTCLRIALSISLILPLYSAIGIKVAGDTEPKTGVPSR